VELTDPDLRSKMTQQTEPVAVGSAESATATVADSAEAQASSPEPQAGFQESSSTFTGGESGPSMVEAEAANVDASRQVEMGRAVAQRNISAIQQVDEDADRVTQENIAKNGSGGGGMMGGMSGGMMGGMMG